MVEEEQPSSKMSSPSCILTAQEASQNLIFFQINEASKKVF